jgi:hypothetical protein
MYACVSFADLRNQNGFGLHALRLRPERWRRRGQKGAGSIQWRSWTLRMRALAGLFTLAGPNERASE